MMATADKEMQTTECPVCHEKYSNPKILPCAHLLCRDCLVSWMKTKSTALCPLCRTAIADPKFSNIKNWDAFVDSLPTDHTMSVMIESLNIFSEKHVCHVHSNIDARSLCLHCSVKLCQGCIEVHKKLPSTSFHKVEDLATLTPEHLAASRQEPCSVHPDKTAELVCVDHNILICQLCATAKHRTCSEVTYVSEAIKKYKQLLLEMESKLSTAESSMNQALTELEVRLLKAEKSSNATLAEIDTMCDSLLKSVETNRKRLKKIVTEKTDKITAALQEQKHTISLKRGRVTSHQGLIKRVLQIASYNSPTVLGTNLESRVSDLDTSLPLDTHFTLTVTLKLDRSAITRIEEELNNIMEPLFAFDSGTGESAWMFHNNCGSNIVLTNNSQTAEVKNDTDGWNRLVMSNEPMSANTLYEIIVEETDSQYNAGCTAIGVCEESPLSVTLLSDCFKMKTFVGVNSAHGIRHHQMLKESCPALWDVKVGSRLGVMVDTSHSLHVYVDRKDQGVLIENVAHPCYAVLELYLPKKVTTLPVSIIQ